MSTISKESVDALREAELDLAAFGQSVVQITCDSAHPEVVVRHHPLRDVAWVEGPPTKPPTKKT